MEAKHKTKQNTERLVQFRAPADLVDRFGKIATKRERTLSQELRFLMQRRIDEDQDLKEAA